MGPSTCWSGSPSADSGGLSLNLLLLNVYSYSCTASPSRGWNLRETTLR